MGPYQWTPRSVATAIRYSGLGVHSVGPVGDFLDYRLPNTCSESLCGRVLRVQIRTQFRCLEAPRVLRGGAHYDRYTWSEITPVGIGL